MTRPDTDAAITVDQFVGRPPADVWRALTEPDLLARWWVSGDVVPVVGHEFTLDLGLRPRRSAATPRYEMMGPRWRDEVLPRPVEAVAPGTAGR